jgi:predicted HTH domain antitoxin
MNLTVEIPDGLARQMHLDEPAAQRRALITLALKSYRAGELSRGQVGELLNLSFAETEALLKEHGCNMHLTVEEFERQSEQLEAYISK